MGGLGLLLAGELLGAADGAIPRLGGVHGSSAQCDEHCDNNDHHVQFLS